MSSAHAFIGPSAGQNPGSGGGLFNVDSSNNIGFGTNAPAPVSTFNSTSTESGPSTFGYVFTVASSTNPGLSLKNLTSGNTYVWSSRNFGNLQLYRESATLPGYVVMDINQYGDVAIGQRATSTGGVARLFVGGNIQSSGSFIGAFSGNLSAGNVTGPSAFGTNYGTYNYAAPGAFAIGTTTTTGLPSNGLYVGGNIGVGTISPGDKLDVTGNIRLSGSTLRKIDFGLTGTGDPGVDSNGTKIILRGGATEYANVPRYALGVGAAGTTWFSTGGDMAWYTEAGQVWTERIRLTSAGNVGIGTSTPPNLLTVAGDAQFQRTGGGSNLYIQTPSTDARIFAQTQAGAQQLLLNPGGGNVGIGTTTPGTKLDVAGGLKIFGDPALQGLNGANMVIDGAPNNYSRVEFRQNAGSSHYGYIQTRDASTNNVQMEFATGNTVRMVIGGTGLSGNVGIATTTPGSPLTVAGTVYSSTGGFKFPDGTTQTTAFLGSSQTLSAANVTGPAAFGSNYGTYAYAFPSALAIGTSTTTGLPANGLAVIGNVGIGTTAPGSKLTVNGDIGIQEAGTQKYHIDYFNGGLNFSETTIADYRLFIKDGGNVGIGNADAPYKLTINSGTSDVFIRARNNAATRYRSDFQINSGGLMVNAFDDTGGVYLPMRLDGSTIQLSASASNANTLFLNSSGNVGIGMTTPGAKLDVQGLDAGIGSGNETLRIRAAATSDWLTLGTDSTNRFSWIRAVRSGTGENSLVLQGIGGNVGIGTSTPGYTLDVNGTARIRSTGLFDGSLTTYGTLQTASNLLVNYGATINNNGGNTSAYDFGVKNGQGGYSLYAQASTGNVGIATTTPSEKLEVVGNVKATSFIGALASSLSAANITGPSAFGTNYGTYAYAFPSALAIGTTTTSGLPANGLYVNGSVGIGTTGPAQKLDVVGGSLLANNTSINLDSYSNRVAAGALTQTSGGWGLTTAIGGNDGTGHSWALGSNGSNLYLGYENGVAAGTIQTYLQADTNRNLYLVPTSGNVGIGTSTPATKLEVAGDTQIDGDFYLNTTPGTKAIKRYSSGAWRDAIQFTNGGNITIIGSQGVDLSSTGYGAMANFASAGTQAALISGNQYNTGMKTLVVRGGIGQTANLFEVQNSTTTQLVIVDTNGNVGIGTTGPNGKLAINTNQASAPDLTLGDSSTYYLGLGYNLGSATKAYVGNSSAIAGARFDFRMGGFTEDKTVMTINGSNVGIATTTPSEKLTVSGNILASGSITASSFVGALSGNLSAANVTGPAAFGSNYGTYSYAFPGALAVGTSTTTGLPTEGLYVKGNVGIGTTGPESTLDVQLPSSASYVRLSNTAWGWRLGSLQSGSQFMGMGVKKTAADNNYIAYTGNNAAVNHSVIQVGYGGDLSYLYQAHQADGATLTPSTYFTILNSGNVGIGTTGPQNKFVVSNGGAEGLEVRPGFSSGQTMLLAYNRSSPSYNDIVFDGGNYIWQSSDVEKMRLTSTGLLGIGTSTPQTKLSIVSTDDTRGIRINNTLATSYAETQFAASGAEFRIGVGGGSTSGGFANNFYLWNTANGTLMTVTPTGGVGIGTSTPASRLSVVGNQNLTGTLIVGQSTNGAVGGYFGAGGNINQPVAQYDDLQILAANNLILTAGGVYTPRIYIASSSGNVGIATTTPAASLAIVSGVSGASLPSYGTNLLQVSSNNRPLINISAPSSDNTAGIIWNNPSTSDAARVTFDNSASKLTLCVGNGCGSAVTLAGGNKFGIATTTPQYALSVIGSYYSAEVQKGNSGAAMTIDWSAGNTQHVILTAATTFTFSNGQPGARYTLILKQDATGSRTVTWPASVRWGSAGVPTLSTAANTTDYVGFNYNGVDSKYDGLSFAAGF